MHAHTAWAWHHAQSLSLATPISPHLATSRHATPRHTHLLLKQEGGRGAPRCRQVEQLEWPHRLRHRRTRRVQALDVRLVQVVMNDRRCRPSFFSAAATNSSNARNDGLALSGSAAAAAGSAAAAVASAAAATAGSMAGAGAPSRAASRAATDAFARRRCASWRCSLVGCSTGGANAVDGGGGGGDGGCA